MSDPSFDFFDQVSKMDKITSVELSFDARKLAADGLLNKRPYSDEAFFAEIQNRMIANDATHADWDVTFDDGVVVGIVARLRGSGFKYRYRGLHRFIRQAMKGEPLWAQIYMQIHALFPSANRRLLEQGIRERIWEGIPDFSNWAVRKATEQSRD